MLYTFYQNETFILYLVCVCAMCKHNERSQTVSSQHLSGAKVSEAVAKTKIEKSFDYAVVAWKCNQEFYMLKIVFRYIFWKIDNNGNSFVHRSFVLA